MLIVLICLYEDYTGKFWSIGLHNVKVLCIIIIMLFISSKVQIHESLIGIFVGKVSFELYMIHGLVIKFLIDCGVKDTRLDQFGILVNVKSSA